MPHGQAMRLETRISALRHQHARACRTIKRRQEGLHRCGVCRVQRHLHQRRLLHAGFAVMPALPHQCVWPRTALLLRVAGRSSRSGKWTAALWLRAVSGSTHISWVSAHALSTLSDMHDQGTAGLPTDKERTAFLCSPQQCTQCSEWLRLLSLTASALSSGALV